MDALVDSLTGCGLTVARVGTNVDVCELDGDGGKTFGDMPEIA